MFCKSLVTSYTCSQVTIGAITTNPSANDSGASGSRTFFRSPGQAVATSKAVTTNKVTDVAATGILNGLPVGVDSNLESIEDKPWRKPGMCNISVVGNLFRTTDRFETELFLRTGL